MNDKNKISVDEDKALAIIEGSMCIDCENRMTRHVLPIDYTEFEIEEEDLMDEDGMVVPMLHNVCLIAQMDLDYIVLDCNKFSPISSKKKTPKIKLPKI